MSNRRSHGGPDLQPGQLTRRFSDLAPDAQLRVLAAFGHELTMAARDAYTPGELGLHAPERVRAINEVQHRVFAHILALATADLQRYPDDVLIAIVLELGDAHVRAQSRGSLARALEYEAARTSSG